MDRSRVAPSRRSVNVLARAWLLVIILAGSCAVYDPSLVSRADTVDDGGFGGLIGGNEGGAPPAQSSAGQASSSPAGAGQASAGEGGSPGLPPVREDAEGGSRSAPGAGGNDGTTEAGSGGEVSRGGSDSTGGAGGTSCVAPWRNRSDCDQCITQQQPDLQACAVILDCYVSKNCGPSSCANPDEKCGPNVLGLGAAAYQIAQSVYACTCK